MKPFALVTVALAFAALAADAAAQNPMRPGNWEVSMQMSMPNMPMQMPPMKMTQCVTAEQIESPEKAFPTGPSQNPNNCKVSDYKVSGSTVTWKMACTGEQPMTGSGEMRFTGDAYDGIINMAMQGQEMTMKYTGKRLGDCTP